jgi:UDP-N-acetylglucosamine:LPS N-acetylglucosamine transferase
MHDIVDLLPLGLGRLMRAVYLAQIDRWPESWEMTLGHLRPGTRAHRCVTRLLGAGRGRVLQVVAGADLVISTHPFASQVLGRLRHEGTLRCPVATYLTDASVHALWVARGVDLHIAIHPSAAEQARALGARTALARAAVPDTPVVTRSRADLGLPPNRRVAAVVGGSLGIGDLEDTARQLLKAGLAPVVLCGRNHSLERRLSSWPGVIALGWRDDIREIFAVADVVVQNSGGFMTLEALAAGVPLVSYGVLPGHGRANAAALEASGLAPWARSAGDLPSALAHAIARAGRCPSVEAPELLDVLASDRPSGLVLAEPGAS